MEYLVSEIAKLLDGQVEGDGNLRLNNISRIDQGKTGTLSFLSNPVYTKYIYNTRASAVIVNKDFKAEKKISCTLIRVDDAYVALAKLLEFYNQSKPGKEGIEQPSYISSSSTLGEKIYVGAFAYIGKDTLIGNRVKIYPNAYIGDNVKVGDDTIIYSGAKIYPGCKIGALCIIHAGAVIGADGFGFAPNKDGTYIKIAQTGDVILEDCVEIGANSTVDAATIGSTVIKSGVKLDNLVHIGHNSEVGENTVMAAQVGISGSTQIEKNCVIGGQVGISGHITIGEGTKLGPQSGIMSSVKPGSVLLGTPAVEFKTAMKSYSIIRNLPRLRNDLIQLQRRLEEIEKQIKLISLNNQ
jgi:UDP-3-O-[3-hydroxymyristoyl] glucosamine N-acyltransferase